MEMTEQLRTAIEKVASMQHPSLASILRRNRYEYEAQVVEHWSPHTRRRSGSRQIREVIYGTQAF
jgi:Tfp pilus assembly protein PilN